MTSARWTAALTLAALLTTAHAAEPNDQERQWDATLATLVQVLAGQGDASLLRQVSAPSAFIAPFDMNRTEAITVLPDRLLNGNIVSARGYLHPSVSSASDIVADLTANGTIDEETMRRLSPATPEDLRRADATMARWFESALEVKAGDPIAVIALYDDGKNEPIRSPSLTFVLVRGEFTPAGTARIIRVLYGPMQSAIK